MPSPTTSTHSSVLQERRYDGVRPRIPVTCARCLKGLQAIRHRSGGEFVVVGGVGGVLAAVGVGPLGAGALTGHGQGPSGVVFDEWWCLQRLVRFQIAVGRRQPRRPGPQSLSSFTLLQGEGHRDDVLEGRQARVLPHEYPSSGGNSDCSEPHHQAFTWPALGRNRSVVDVAFSLVQDVGTRHDHGYAHGHRSL